MKKKMFKNWCYLLALLFFTSCSDDEQKGWDSTKELSAYGLNFQLSNGAVWHNNNYDFAKQQEFVFTDTYVNGSGENVTNTHVGFTATSERITTGNFMVSLYGEGISFNPALKTAQGKGACICFHFASSDQNKLTAGKYKFSDSQEPFTFIAYSLSEYNTYADNMATQLKPSILVAGEAEVIEEANGNYQILFNCKTSFEGVVKGRYTGQLIPCDIRQSSISVYKNVTISTLLESVIQTIHNNGVVIPTPPTPDVANPAFYSTAKNNVFNADNAAKGTQLVDLALVYDKKQDAVLFESPIRMVTYLDHAPDRNYPCHTKYMNAPANFTDAEFNKLANEETTLDFTMEENQSVRIPLNAQFPKFVFFETGKGVKGVVRINETKPAGIGKDIIVPDVLWVEFDLAPQIVADIVCNATILNERLK